MLAFLRSVAVLASLMLPLAAHAEERQVDPAAPPAAAEPAGPITDPAEIAATLAIAGPLGEKALGDPNAPVTMIEYASLTCSHCGNFYRKTFTALKERYIDTGKVYFVLREFPLDSLAMAAAMLAHCAPADDYFTIIDKMFVDQNQWAFVDDPGTALLDLLKPYGFTQESFDACLKDESKVAGIVDVAKRGQSLGVQGTPAFFFNGELTGGELKIEQIDAIVAPLLTPNAE